MKIKITHYPATQRWLLLTFICVLYSRVFLYILLLSVVQSCPTLCNPMDCSTPGFPAHHQLPELVQTHVHRVSDAIQQSHPLLSPSPPSFSLSQHQDLFQWFSFLHQIAKLAIKWVKTSKNLYIEFYSIGTYFKYLISKRESLVCVCVCICVDTHLGKYCCRSEQRMLWWLDR